MAGIAVTGVLNLGVSFFLAFRVALRSRGIRLADSRIYGAIRRRLWRSRCRSSAAARLPPRPQPPDHADAALDPDRSGRFAAAGRRRPRLAAGRRAGRGRARGRPVLAAVHHAEVVAHRVGEPYGTLVLALAVTVIEVVLIVALMLAGGPATGPLARDTVFATVMIVCNGVVGLCVLVGALRHGVIAFRVEGTSPALAVLAALATLTLVMPTFTTSTPGPTFAPSQLAFAGIVSLVLYGVFVFVQTVRHREYFLPVAGEDEPLHAPAARAAPRSQPRAARSCASSPSSGSRRRSRRRSSAAVHRPARRRPWSGSSIALLVLASRDAGPRCAPPRATTCRRASTSRSAPRSRASA